MKASVEISLYPLNTEPISKIEDFIARLNKYENVRVWTNDLSTQIFGEYDLVMDILKKEFKETFDSGFPSVFVIKIHNPS